MIGCSSTKLGFVWKIKAVPVVTINIYIYIIMGPLLVITILIVILCTHLTKLFFWFKQMSPQSLEKRLTWSITHYTVFTCCPPSCRKWTNQFHLAFKRQWITCKQYKKDNGKIGQYKKEKERWWWKYNKKASNSSKFYVYTRIYDKIIWWKAEKKFYHSATCCFVFNFLCLDNDFHFFYDSLAYTQDK